MPDGVYTVSWSAVSVDDGHTTTDSFSFGVGVKAPSGRRRPRLPPTASGPTVLGVVGKALLYAGLMLVVAVAVVGEGVFGGAPKARPRIAAWAGLAAVVGSIGLLVSQQQATHASMGRFLGSQVARTPIALVVVCVIAAVFALLAARTPGAMAALGGRHRRGDRDGGPRPRWARDGDLHAAAQPGRAVGPHHGGRLLGGRARAC